MTPTQQIFDTQNEPSAQSYYKAWGVFRNLGIGLIIIAGLVMVISQAAGMEIFDAYTVRKVLPRLVIAMIGIALSWFILQFVVTFFNDIGQWAHDLILAPFSGMDPAFNGISTALNYLLFGGGITVAVIGVAGLGFAGVLSLLGTIALALLIGLVVLAVRQLVIVVAILLAPLAIAAYILPGTQKLWNFWRETLLTALMMFPIIMAFLAAGQAMSSVANHGTEVQKLISILIYFAPYALLPFAFKLAGGLMSTIFSIANDKSRGLFDRGKNFRSETRKQRMGEFASGQRNGGRLVNGWAARRALASQGGFSISKAGRSRFAGARGHLEEQARAEALKRDNGYASGDTDANALAQDINMTRGNFISEYAKSYKKRTGASDADSNQAAVAALGRMEASYGAKLGTKTMAQAAFQAYHADNTSYLTEDGRTDWTAINKDAERMMKTTGMSAADVTRVVKSNPTRADRSAVGFGGLMTHFEGLMGNPGPGGDKGPLLKTNEQLEDAALEGAKPGDILMGHLSTAKAMLGAQTRATQQAIQRASSASGAEQDVATDHVIDMFATMASQVDQGGGTSREKATQLADQLSKKVSVDSLPPKLKAMLDNIINVKEVVRDDKGKPVMVNGSPEMRVVSTNAELTMKSIADELGTVSERFGSQRRTYNNAAYADAAARAAAAAADPASPGPIAGA